MRFLSIGIVALGSVMLSLATIAGPTFAAQVTLQSLAEARFGELTPAESQILRAVLRGETAWIGPSKSEDDPANDPSKAAQWGQARTIRSEVIRWLYVDPMAAHMVALSGVSVWGARIKGKLDLSHIKMDLPLELRNCEIHDGVELSDAETRLLDFRGSWTGSVSGAALVVRGDLLLSRAHTEGQINLDGTRIQGTLSFRKGTVLIQGEGEDALSLKTAHVEGDVYFNDFETNKLVDISLSSIDGNLVFLRTQFEGGRASGLQAINAQVRGAFAWSDIRPESSDVLLDLTFARVGGLGDDAPSWPKYILMDQFVYDKFDEPDKTPKDLTSRLAWLGKQPDFRPQPYLQLARIYSASGRDDDATEVLIEKERQERKGSPVLSWFLGSTIGYGYKPMRAFGWSGVIVLIGWLIFWCGNHVGLMVPSGEGAYSPEQGGQLPAYYPPFNSLVYSLETFLPFVDLHQGKYWSPASKSVGGRRHLFLRFLPWYLRFQILSGWLLSTAFLAGLTGLVHKS